MPKISDEEYKKMESMTPEEQKAWWDNHRQKELEEDFEEFMKSPFETLRSQYYYKHYNREEAIKIQKMIEERLGTPDPEGEMPEEGWRKSNWCVD